MQYWALIVDCFRQSRDRKIFWVMLIMSIIVAGAMACVGFEPGKVTILFGMWEIDTQWLTAGGGLREDLIAGIIVDILMDTILGQVGIILVIIATAGFLPTWMDRGSIDVVISKPMSRWGHFLGRYLGSMAFILFHAAVFVGLTFLAAGLRWGCWIPGYLWSIPLVVLLFSYLYCVSALVAVVFRSTVAAVMLTLFAWCAFSGIQVTDDLFTTTFPEWQKYRTAYKTIHLARWIVPKTQDITYLAKRYAKAAGAEEFMPADTPENDRRMMEGAVKVEAERIAMSPVYTIGSSLMFEVVVLLLAAWKFARTDF